MSGRPDIPYVNLAAQYGPIQEEVFDAVRRVLEHGQFILGPEVTELEDRLATMLDVDHVIAVGSGTDAISLALLAHGVGAGDEVVTVSHSFVATATAIVHSGATPVFVDICDETMTMDPACIEPVLTSRTKAVLPVHLNGHPCDLSGISALCDAKDLILIEDCAQAIGARSRGRPVGSTHTGCFSLHPLKILSAAGDGGFITTCSGELAGRLRRSRNHGLVDRDHCDSVGYNSRLDTIQAAIVLAKLRHLDGVFATRQAHAEAFRDNLGTLLRMPPVEQPGERSVWSAFVVRHPQRDALLERLHAVGVDAKVHYPVPIHLQPAFRGCRSSSLDVTDRVVREILSLPISMEMTSDMRDESIARIVTCVEELEHDLP